MTSILHNNLDALAAHHPQLAATLRRTAPRADVQWLQTPDPATPSARAAAPDGRTVTLASAHHPQREAQRFAGQVDPESHGLIVLVGFGLGYHVRKAIEHAGRHTAMIVYEPDAALLRAVIERIDLADIFARPGLALLVGPTDTAALTRAVEQRANLLAQGVQIVTHPPVRMLHPQRVRDFASALREISNYWRANFATNLVNSRRTVANLLANAHAYAAAPPINALRDAAADSPAVLVAAGPSLAKNARRLADPAVRDRVVIIAAQTALKPLLDRGVKPHFVTALDHHEISSRFYEGLPPLPDVTLVAEPKVNPVVLARYPGPVRMLGHALLDDLLRDALPNQPHDRLPAGTTVAHLSFYLAQYLGCDPIILTGQDLGFSDGLYYCPGTAIHDVWAPELGMFNSLETMEWKRIARHKAHLHRRQDIHGQPIYTDEQMLTYLRQFERDFANAPQTIIDATEGGLPKQHTQRLPLAAALATHAPTSRAREEAVTPPPAPANRSHEFTHAAKTRHALDRLRDDVRDLHQTTQQTLALLDRMLDDLHHPDRLAAHFEQLSQHKQRVAELRGAFGLVDRVSQVGAYNRHRADRAIALAADSDAGLTPQEKQRMQIQRDAENLRWLLEACELTRQMLTDALGRDDTSGHPEQTPAPQVTVDPMSRTTGTSA